MSDNRKNGSINLGEGPIVPLLLRMSLPTTLSMLIMALYNLVDTFWIARLSAEGVAALTICFPLQMIIGAVGVGTGVGAGSFASRSLGAGNTDNANRAAGHVVFLSSVSGILLITAVSLFGPIILKLFGAIDSIMIPASDYLSIVVIGSPFLMFMMMSGNLFRAAGSPNLSMFVMLFSSGLNLILDPLLIFGYGPFPAMGISGAALATVISQVLASTLSAYFLFSRHTSFRFRLGYLAPSITIIGAIYAVGLPSSMMQFVMSAVLTYLNHVLGNFGEMAIAGLGIAFRVSGLVMMLIFGFGAGLMPMVGFNYGAGKTERMWRVVNRATVIVSVAAIILSACIELLAPWVVKMFSSDPELYAATLPALRIIALGVVANAPQVMWVNTFHGLGQGMMGMTLSLVRQLGLLVPLLIILPPRMGVEGVWWAMALSSYCALPISFYLIRRRKLRDLPNR